MRKDRESSWFAFSNEAGLLEIERVALSEARGDETRHIAKTIATVRPKATVPTNFPERPLTTIPQ